VRDGAVFMVRGECPSVATGYGQWWRQQRGVGTWTVAEGRHCRGQLKSSVVRVKFSKPQN
jgi:hypothetical protein